MARSEAPADTRAAIYLNVGCGRRFSRDSRWLNVDLAPAAPEVMRLDAGGALPFAADSFEAVFHSHVIEHLDPAAGLGLLRECRRILRPGGVLRVVVPDLETIARCYLARLAEARAGAAGAPARYRWALAELFDQMVREKPGGEMLELLRSGDRELRAYALERGGAEVSGMVREIDARPAPEVTPPAPWTPRAAARALRKWWHGPPAFRDSGEVHRWMYDEYSLRSALAEAGFADVRRHAASSSAIAGWAGFAIDTDANGRALKPDSLYVEAVKPRECAP